MVSLLRPLVDIAVAEAGDQYDSMVNLKTELSSLKRIVSLIEGALPEAEDKQVDNLRIRVWLGDLDDICYDARDILDEFVTVAASIRAKRASKRVKSNSLHYFSLRVSNRFATVIPLRLRFRLANKIKNLRKRLDSMKKDMETGQLLDFVGDAGCSPNAPKKKKNRPKAGSYPDQHLFVGREVEKKKIMEKLLNLKENHVEVVLIWGMGGVGKTTLAQYVYNDERVTEELYPRKNRRWLNVGANEFNAEDIISKITKESNTNDDVEDYQDKLKDKFIGDRFLIVLDDVWNVGINEWELFCNPLYKIRKGGLIIITTRTKKVITAINTPVHLKPLSNEDCWQIFESHAFVDGHSCSDLEQKKGNGKKIVEKLKGLPLAAKVVGHSLSNEPDVQIWRSFLEAHKWKLSTRDDDVMSALRWSYNLLSQHLKKCFTYCSLFPKDHVFDEKMLVKMWMAHGYIQSAEGGEKIRPEDTGADYFKQLVNASFFQCVDNKYFMHDMIHDLAMVVSKEEFLRIHVSRLDAGQLEKVRHISIHCTYKYYLRNLSLLCTLKRSILKRLLTLLALNDWKFFLTPETSIAHITPLNVIQDIFKQLKSIRVLVLESSEINYIPECISDLIHLRYLDIKNTRVSRIPDTLCDLHNLQTLVVPIDNLVVTILPKNIVNMANLRHLRAHLLTCKGVKNLTSLQELHSISISKGDKISELGDLRQLYGYLEIKCLENVTSEEDAAQAKMQEKADIDELRLKFTEDLGDTDVQTKVLDALKCPPNLRYLRIYGYNGHTSPSWMVDGELIKHLQTLWLEDCPRLELLPPLGQLHCLKELRFCMVGKIKILGEEFYRKQINQKVFFPSLKNLDLIFMENLREWGDIEDTSVTFFPCLETLDISDCPKLVSALPHVNVMQSLSRLQIRSCDGLVVLELDILVSLTHLRIEDCRRINLQKMKFRSLSSLKKLKISHCPRLNYFPRLDAIEELDVRLCTSLTSLTISDRGLNSLRSLTVLKCPMLETLFEDAPTSSSSSSSSSSALRKSRLRSLTTDNRLVFSKIFEHEHYDLFSLRDMWIGKFPKVESLFNEIVKNNWHKLTLLETLVIFQYDDLVSLPSDIHKLSSLKKLCLHDCPQLQALPVDGLPLSLEVLVIIGCPLLYERCQVESGADWHKIRHIPEREILQNILSIQVYDLGEKFNFRGLLGLLIDETLNIGYFTGSRSAKLCTLRGWKIWI